MLYLSYFQVIKFTHLSDFNIKTPIFLIGVLQFIIMYFLIKIERIPADPY